MEKYLEYDNRKVRRTFTRYRVSDHNLQIEKGWWTNPNKQDGKTKGIPQEQCICKRCETDQVEDETHIFTCEAHKHWRDKYGITCQQKEDI